MTEIQKLSKDIQTATKELIDESTHLLNQLGALSPEERPNITSILLLRKNMFTYETISSLLRKGQLEEALVLMRLFLERTALAFKISKNHIKPQDVKKIKSTKCISELSNHFPDAGRWWGELSKVVHIDWGLFLGMHIRTLSSKTVTFRASMKDPKAMATTNLWLCFLAELNLAVSEFIAKDNIDGVSSWSLRSDGVWTYSTNLVLAREIALWSIQLNLV